MVEVATDGALRAQDDRPHLRGQAAASLIETSLEYLTEYPKWEMTIAPLPRYNGLEEQKGVVEWKHHPMCAHLERFKPLKR